MTAASRLERAILDALETLSEVVGYPVDDESTDGRGCDRFPVNGSLVNRDEVPLVAWRGACAAVDYLIVAVGVMDPESDSVSVEDGLAAMTKASES